MYIYILPSAQDEVSLTHFVWVAEAGGQREYVGQPRAASGIEAGTRTMTNIVSTYHCSYCYYTFNGWNCVGWCISSCGQVNPVAVDPNVSPCSWLSTR